MSKDVPERVERSSGLAVPESVSVAVAELAEDLREGLLALAVGAGLQVMTRAYGAGRRRRLRSAGQA